MIRTANCGERMWAEAVNTAAYLANRSPHRALIEKKTPEEYWTRKVVDLRHLKVFGCIAYAHVPKEKRKKWDTKSLPYIFVGYCENSKGYRLFEQREPGKIIRSRDVVFMENKFSLKDKGTLPTPVTSRLQNNVDSASSDEVEKDCDRNMFNISGDEVPETEDEAPFHGFSDGENDEHNHQEENGVEESNIAEPSRARTAEERKLPSRFSDFVLYQSSIDKDIPTTDDEAMASKDKEHWQTAMKMEMDALKQYGVWELVNPSVDQKVIKCKWVFSVKCDENGVKVKHKARLVAKGFNQEY